MQICSQILYKSMWYQHVLWYPDCNKGTPEPHQTGYKEGEAPLCCQHISLQRIHLELWGAATGWGDNKRSLVQSVNVHDLTDFTSVFFFLSPLKDMGGPEPHGQRHPVLWRRRPGGCLWDWNPGTTAYYRTVQCSSHNFTHDPNNWPGL